MRQATLTALRRLLLGCALALTLASCRGDLTPENYARIENGMSLEQVTGILGKPSDSSTLGLGGLTGTNAVWSDGKTTISVQFVNDKVQFKQMAQSSQQR